MLNQVALRRLSIAGVFIMGLTFGLREINQAGGGYANYPVRVISETEQDVSISIAAGATGAQIAKIPHTDLGLPYQCWGFQNWCGE